jgi:hypothetical protein
VARHRLVTARLAGPCPDSKIFVGRGFNRDIWIPENSGLQPLKFLRAALRGIYEIKSGYFIEEDLFSWFGLCSGAL